MTKNRNIGKLFLKTGAPEGGCPDFAKIIKESSIDESLFEQITRCFSSRLMGFAKYICRDSSKGQDAFQDAMIASMKYLSTYRGDSPIEPWLRRIVVSSCARQRRGKKNNESINRSFDDTALDATPLSDEPRQELLLIFKERFEIVIEEIAKLSDPDRSLLELHDLKEMPIDELADKFNLSTDAVKSRLKRARSEVRDALVNKL